MQRQESKRFFLSDRSPEEKHEIPIDDENMYVFVTKPKPTLLPWRISELVISPPTRTKAGTIGSSIGYHYQDRLNLQTPPLRLKFALTVYQTKRGPSRVLELDLGPSQATTESLEFAKLLGEIDNAVRSYGVVNKEKLYPGKTEEEVSDMYLATTRERISKKDGQVYPPRLNLKIWDDSQLFDTDNSRIARWEPQVLQKNSWVECIMKCGGVRWDRNMFTVNWSVSQARIAEQPWGSLPSTMEELPMFISK